MKKKPTRAAPPRNWVAKHAQQFHRAKVEPNKKKAYIRTPKHRKRGFGVLHFWCLIPAPLSV